MPAAGSPSFLAWAVSHRFVRYVSSQPDGSCGIGGGATYSESELFLFPREESATDAAPGAAAPERFTGCVIFTAHGGVLRLVIARPRIERLDEGLTLTVEPTPEPDEGSRIRLARLDEASSSDSAAMRTFRARLAEDGVELFGGSYLPGFELAPLTVV